jgi:hypothetical protein
MLEARLPRCLLLTEHVAASATACSKGCRFPGWMKHSTAGSTLHAAKALIGCQLSGWLWAPQDSVKHYCVRMLSNTVDSAPQKCQILILQVTYTTRKSMQESQPALLSAAAGALAAGASAKYMPSPIAPKITTTATTRNKWRRARDAPR